ncbi:TetR/AcrR family transcriptional regulator [Neolewinella aurantiaca]|uniref:TetR/AcrR family transcriptional regulator n=1 Tax=Neolewinella aurantiaca TaxID=2602767 RepID=A0A5C7F6P3_9BACT|nr:TetR/AcrR family transcriptional regulator [Neolewinella aurantiaca]TXF85683.1 TetR/AcrR family transcriptional regulator [Neolewinella aurantiaca]
MKNEEEVKKEILAAAKRLIQQHGIDKTTMRDVARAASKGKSTLYYYFKNKEEIIDAVIREEHDELYLKVKRAVDKKKTMEEKLKAYLITKTSILKQKRKQYEFLIDNESHHFNIKNFFLLSIEVNGGRELVFIRSILMDGAKNEGYEFPVSEMLGMDVIAESFLTYSRGVEIEVSINMGLDLIEEKAEMMISILLKGLK